MFLTAPIKLLIALLLGSAIGLERESYERDFEKFPKQDIGSMGIRSFALITILGCLSGLIYHSYFSIFLLISISFMAVLLGYYIIGSIFIKDHGITTELAILYSYFLGLLIGLEAFPIQLIIAITVVLILILSVKERIHSIVSNIKQNELQAFISYAIISLVILPFLPNASYALKDVPFINTFLSSLQINLGEISNIEIINPFNLWKIVTIISGVEIAGYALEKTLGQKKGWVLTSLAGGFISSTSTTQSLAQKSTRSSNINRLTAAAIFANFASFLQHFILIATVNALFLTKNLVYIFAISLSALLLGFYFINKKEKDGEELTETKNQLKEDKIFALKPALMFACVFLLIKFFSKTALVLFGQGGFLITIVVAALTGLDAVTMNVSEIAGKTITFQTGVLALILANAVNLIAKTFYSFSQGSRKFAVSFGISMAIIILSSLFGLLPFIK